MSTETMCAVLWLIRRFRKKILVGSQRRFAFVGNGLRILEELLVVLL
jgi:hypothetical protein